RVPDHEGERDRRIDARAVRQELPGEAGDRQAAVPQASPGGSEMTAPRLRMTELRKSYGPTAALRGVDLELRPGEVHALVGEKGAGKSTLMKVLRGAERPAGGMMELDGQPYSPSGPQDARRRGVAMIYQELAVCPDLSVEANVLLGLESASLGFLRKAADRDRVRAALAELGHPEIQPEASVSGLTPAARQVVEIA